MKGRFMDESQLTKRPLGRFDRLMLWLLRVGELPVHEFKDGEVRARNVLSLYWQILRNYPVAIIISITGVVVASTAGIVSPYIFKLFLDILGSKPTFDVTHTLISYAVMLLGVNLLAWAGWRASFITMGYLASEVVTALRQQAFTHLIQHSHRFFSSSFTGSLVQRVNRYAMSYDRLADRFVFDIVPVVIQVLGIMFILFREHRIIALIILVWLILFTAWNYIFAQWKLKFDVSRAAQDSRSSGQLADAISNQQTVELYRSYNKESELYVNEIVLQKRYTRFSWQSSSVIDGIQALFIIIVEFAIFYIGIGLWQKGELTVGTFVLVQSYIIQLSDRLWSFSRMIRDVYESFADAKEMTEIILLPHEITNVANALPLHASKGAITFQDVDFTFHNKKVLNGFNLRIRAGEKVALVGKSGAGKTTIIRLLFRQYDPSSGKILIDGNDIKLATLESLGETLSLVPQEPTLFNRSLLENIRYGRQTASDEEVIAAAKLAHCHEFIMSHPDGYASLVGERGIKLSGGERQRIAIARAFLRNSPILVLDEATSSLDSESEHYIQDSLERLMKGKTTIVIAHRLSTIRKMDRIVVIDKGNVVEDGTHEKLITSQGIYQRLWDIQQGGFIGLDEDPVEIETTLVQ